MASTRELSVLRSGFDEALLGLGRNPIHDVFPDGLLVPHGSTREHRH